MSSTILVCFFLLSDVLTCIVEIEKLNVEKNQPLFLERTEKGLRLATPTFNKWKAVLDFQSNNVIIGCPGLKNYLLYGDEMFGDRLEGSCTFAKSGRTVVIKIGERLYNIYKFKCQNRLESFEIATNKSSCGFNDSTIYKVGYVVNNELFPLFGGCHHEETGRTLWTRHKILGVGMVHFKSNYTNANMKNNNLILFHKMDISEAFILVNIGCPLVLEKAQFSNAGGQPPSRFISPGSFRRNQRKKMEEIMGKAKSKLVLKRNMDVLPRLNLFRPKTSNCTRGKMQLFISSTSNFSGFQSKRESGNLWKMKSKEEDFTVLTGVSGLLELSDGEGNKNALSMGDNGTLRIPKYFWKLVQNQKSACVGFIVPNFPVAYISNNLANDCSSCYTFGWRKLQGKEFSIKCCEYSTLKRIVPEMPYMKCKSVLRF